MSFASAENGLPDPEYHAELYADVTMKRFIAWIIDTLIVGFMCLIVLPFTAFTAVFFLPLLFLVLSFVYRVITIKNRSATWGMRMMAIELRNHQGHRLDGSMAVLHTLGFFIAAGMAILQIISIVLMFTSARGQGLVDHLLGIAMINRTSRF